MKDFLFITAIAGVIIHTIGCCSLANNGEYSGELLSVGFGLFASAMLVMYVI